MGLRARGALLALVLLSGCQPTAAEAYAELAGEYGNRIRPQTRIALREDRMFRCDWDGCVGPSLYAEGRWEHHGDHVEFFVTKRHPLAQMPASAEIRRDRGEVVALIVGEDELWDVCFGPRR
ncbi:MAG: hypothetical protein KDB80_09585 [Planctomycetes bacterium]|nr:hypothetical protein [Planctomycetota bacterium]